MKVSYKKLGLVFGLLLSLALVVTLVVAVGRSGSDAPDPGEGGDPALTREADPRTEPEDAHEEVDVVAALHKIILRPDPAGSPDFSYTDAEMGERMIDGLPVTSLHGQSSFDASNPDLMVAASDYVFVGRVKRRVGTRHPDSLPYPTTDYEVTILDVIKGNLKAGQEIPVTKRGGISKDGSCVEFLHRNDFMLETGEAYVFLGGAESDGKTLGVVGPFGTVPLEDDVAAELRRIGRRIGPNKQEAISKSLEKSKVFARYVAAANNKGAEAELPPEIRNRKRYKSVYEK
ncbi:MAG: hypothetical protein FWE94_04470 [Coriobacteriia bacterium]|nr:hypothetical protein [Coriobacteriia bacterium]